MVLGRQVKLGRENFDDDDDVHDIVSHTVIRVVHLDQLHQPILYLGTWCHIRKIRPPAMNKSS